jgi:hypothetical protein
VGETCGKTPINLTKGAKHKNKEVAKIETPKKGQLQNFFSSDKLQKLTSQNVSKGLKVGLLDIE